MKKNLLVLIPCLYCWLLPVGAEIINLTASLDCSRAEAGNGTCAAGGSGTGIASMTLDTATNKLTWEVSYSRLSSTVTAAHFHGPASPSQNAGTTAGIGTSNPARGAATISTNLATDLLAGRWYINIHSEAFPAGEIRGQVEVGAECDIQLDAPVYTDGETVTADVFRLANSSGATRAIELKVWLAGPGIAPIEVVNTGADGSLVFQPGTTIDLGPTPLFSVAAGLLPGNYEFSCRMLDPVTGQLLAEDRGFFGINTPRPGAPAPQAPGDVIITEVMVDPGAAPDADGEWFEIYNPTDTEFDLLGLVISDDGGDNFTINRSLPIPPRGFLVLGINADAALNGNLGIDYQYANFQLANTGDQIVIANGTTVIDRIDYVAAAFPVQSGIAANLDPDAFDSFSNGIQSNWCDATSLLPSGDLGSPGEINHDCP